MIRQVTDFNDAGSILAKELKGEFASLDGILAALPLQLKGSDQAGKQGTQIFDPIGTNAYIKNGLTQNGFATNCPVPPDLAFLGKGVDAALHGLLIEVQFSNYPFLLNNLLRTELFFKAGTTIGGSRVRVIAVVTKAGMFAASNSTLYYEQARNQLAALAKHGVFSVPLRLVGLFCPLEAPFEARINEYSERRHSRVQTQCRDGTAIARAGAGKRARCTIEFLASGKE